jgi:hypothetical protein
VAEIVGLLTRAHWTEIETVTSYLANAAHVDGIRAGLLVAAGETGFAADYADVVVRGLCASCRA